MWISKVSRVYSRQVAISDDSVSSLGEIASGI